MADIRLTQPPSSRIWLISVTFAVVGLLLWGSAYIVGDATAPEALPQVGAAAGFGAVRAPVLPAEAVPFGTLIPLQTRDLGRLIRVDGVAESRVAANSVWVRASDGHRILLRFEPAPEPGALRGIGPGTTIGSEGYLESIALAEFNQLIDSVGVRIPRPPPGRKFGDLPDPAFARVDSLFIKNYYISVRPQGINPADPDRPAD